MVSDGLDRADLAWFVIGLKNVASTILATCLATSVHRTSVLLPSKRSLLTSTSTMSMRPNASIKVSHNIHKCFFTPYFFILIILINSLRNNHG